MTTLAALDAATQDERHDWLVSTTDDERAQMLGYLIGWDTAAFDQARTWVERLRAGVKA